MTQTEQSRKQLILNRFCESSTENPGLSPPSWGDKLSNYISDLVNLMVANQRMPPWTSEKYVGNLQCKLTISGNHICF